MAKLAAPFANHPLVTDVRQAGMIVAIELQPEPGGTEDGNAVEIANRRGPAMYRTALERGVLLRPLGDVLYWMPPYCIDDERSEEHTSELQSLMRISYAVFCLKKKKYKQYVHLLIRTKNNRT